MKHTYTPPPLIIYHYQINSPYNFSEGTVTACSPISAAQKLIDAPQYAHGEGREDDPYMYRNGAGNMHESLLLRTLAPALTPA